jgi:hypothetical protein
VSREGEDLSSDIERDRRTGKAAATNIHIGE